MVKRTHRWVTQTCLDTLILSSRSNLVELLEFSLPMYDYKMGWHSSTGSVFDSDIAMGTSPVPECVLVGQKEKKKSCSCGAQCHISLIGCWGIKWKTKITNFKHSAWHSADKRVVLQHQAYWPCSPCIPVWQSIGTQRTLLEELNSCVCTSLHLCVCILNKTLKQSCVFWFPGFLF